MKQILTEFAKINFIFQNISNEYSLRLLNSNKIYAEFDTFKNDKIFTPSTKKGKTEGVIYYELAPTRPDLVLKDIIKITNAELLPNYELTFFEKMK